ncbi:Hypothetical protein R9X50_00476600 [Acrodontium crateriforme]|uniref:Pentatricopeptide repeat-containing protein n=1 Tax=Acrodontium crateriforme TaxID=150365 RepID=A0AAQ3M6N7_9PEZI|nr:Hypothetical protein R9X50_00476600 [Acrodontium crateriforme]
MSLFGSPYTRPSLSVTSRNAVGLASVILDCSSNKFIQQKYRSRNQGVLYQPVRLQVRYRSSRSSQLTLEDIFVRSLVIASSCRKHSARQYDCNRETTGTAWSREIDIRNNPNLSQKRTFSTQAKHQRRQQEAEEREEEERREAIAKEEYKDLVDIYNPPPALWDKPRWERPRHPTDYYRLAPRLVQSAEDDERLGPRIILQPEDSEHALQLKQFSSRLTKPIGSINLALLWERFDGLRAPRLRYLSDAKVRRFFAHLIAVDKRHEENAMQRYSVLLNECIGEKVRLGARQWNGAISFAGHWMNRVTSTEVKDAIELWMEMERSGVGATHVTFNIIFDLAVKAGRYALADTIYQEIQHRELPMNRFMRTSMIYYAGLRGDGDAVRQAFRDLVNAGEIVDTAVMNCVILSLIRVGEAAAAEIVFDRMKNLYAQRLGIKAPETWQEDRMVGRSLNRLGLRLRKQRKEHAGSFFGTEFSFDEQREQAQKLAPIAPNSQTYRIIIQHHAYVSGDFDRVCELMAEMKTQGIKIYGSIYVLLLRGFGKHGGYAHTSWSRSNLQAVWDEFLAAATLQKPSVSSEHSPASPMQLAEDESAEERIDDAAPLDEKKRAPRLERASVMSAIDAFYKCAGRIKMLEVWKDVQASWEEMSDDDRERAQTLVDRYVREDSRYLVE